MGVETRYRLVRTIASGGMAHVYEAVSSGERGFERRVAIKRVLPEYANEESMRRMFLDEANIVSRLHHGSIVQVLDYGLVDGTEFIVMEYIDGLDAKRASRRGSQQHEPISEGLALHIVAEVAHALDYAHQCKDSKGQPLSIVHRDVSPQNVLLSWGGDVKLSDFGIAAALGKEEKTATGVVKGKLAYMPPEQFRTSAVGPAADVYALGGSLHAILTGAPPMAEPQLMTQRLGGKPVILDDRLSEPVTHLLRRCLHPEPEERITASELAFEAGQLAAAQLEREPTRRAQRLDAINSTHYVGGHRRSRRSDGIVPRLNRTRGACLHRCAGIGDHPCLPHS